MCKQKLQADLDIHEGLTAQKYIDAMVGPHVKPHVDNHSLAASTSLLASEVSPAMVSTVRFYGRNDLYGSSDVRNCRMPNFIGWAFFVISPISIN